MTTITGVIVDHREPRWVSQADYGVSPTVSQLPAGDVMLATDGGDIILVERKTGADLLESIADGRLFDQAAAMRQQTPWSYIVITDPTIPGPNGNVEGTGWRYNSVQGALLTVQEIGGHIIYCNGRDDFAPCVLRIAGRSRQALRQFQSPPRGIESIAPGAVALASLPGIGPEKALSLLEHLPDAAWAIQYLTDTEWNGEHVTGVANGTRAKVRAALGLDDRHMLAVIPIGLKEGNNSND